MPSYVVSKAPGFEFKDEELASDVMAEHNYVRMPSLEWEWLAEASTSLRQADFEGAITNTLEQALNEKVQLTVKEISTAEAEAVRLVVQR